MLGEIRIAYKEKYFSKFILKQLEQLFASGSVIIGEYSPRLRLGEYLSFIDPERGGFGVIFPEVMIFSEGLCPEEISSLREILRRIPRAKGL
jgi:hypothetical protein